MVRLKTVAGCLAKARVLDPSSKFCGEHNTLVQMLLAHGLEGIEGYSEGEMIHGYLAGSMFTLQIIAFS